MSDAMSRLPWAMLAFPAAVLATRWILRRRRQRLLAPTPPRMPTPDEALALFTGAGGRDRPYVPAPDGTCDAAMETTRAEGSVLVLALADGTVSLYVRGGPSVHGLGTIPEVRTAAATFRGAVASSLERFRPDADGSAPAEGTSVIRARTAEGGVAVRFPLDPPEDHPCADLARLGRALEQAIVAHVS